ncbi:MAG: CbiX/SirB N-terminal domain-containing protein [Candidatus Nanopelagicales bacterium]|nr:CbiX/SirB N-terminal domain-containing protein [Candidatus Nanopelagicales bacterium]MDZ4249511.1 CbiX/SirB N-terminal domain-containing protein [Candidatus Nanopelagicales bacterium]
MTHGAVVLIAHGSEDSRHRSAIADIASAIQQRTSVSIAVAYLQHNRPSPAEAAARLRSPAMLPLLLAAGAHWARDVSLALRGIEPTPRLIEPPTPVQLVPAVIEAVSSLREGGETVVLAVAGSTANDQSRHFQPLATAVAASLGTTCSVAPSPEAVRGLASPGAVIVPILTSPGFLDDRIRAQASQAGAQATATVGSTSSFVQILSDLVRAATRPSSSEQA